MSQPFSDRDNGLPVQREAPNAGHFPYAPYERPPEPDRPLRKPSNPTGRLFLLGVLTGLLLLFYVINSNVFSFVLQNTPLLELYRGSDAASDLIEMCYTVLCVGLPALAVLAILKASRKYPFRIPLGAPRRNADAVLLIFAALGLCLAGSLLSNYVVSWAETNGLGFHSFDAAMQGEALPGDAFGVLLMVLHSAVAPALIEEFAFRGVLMQSLRRYGDWFAILTSALLFGLMHATMTQVPFAIVAGVALGYVALVTGTLWTSVIVHLLNNMLAVLYSVVQGLYGEKTAILFSNVSMYGMLIVGIIALIVYAVRRPHFMRLRPGEETGAKKYAYYLSPTLLIAAVFLLFETAADIYVK